MSVYSQEIMRNLGDWLRSIRERKYQESMQQQALERQKELMKYRQQLAEEQSRKAREEYMKRLEPLQRALETGDENLIKKAAMVAFPNPLDYQRFMRTWLSTEYMKKQEAMAKQKAEQEKIFNYVNTIIAQDPKLQEALQKNDIQGIIKGLTLKNIPSDMIDSYLNIVGVPKEIYSSYLEKAMPLPPEKPDRSLLDLIKNTFSNKDSIIPREIPQDIPKEPEMMFDFGPGSIITREPDNSYSYLDLVKKSLGMVTDVIPGISQVKQGYGILQNILGNFFDGNQRQTIQPKQSVSMVPVRNFLSEIRSPKGLDQTPKAPDQIEKNAKKVNSIARGYKSQRAVDRLTQQKEKDEQNRWKSYIFKRY